MNTENTHNDGDAFTPEEQKLLEHCEVTIQTGVKNFLAVGQALSTIREKRLYKLNGSETFEDYCQTKWNITRQHASRLILALRFNQQLSPNGDKPVLETEGLARRFGQLESDQQKEIAEKVANGADVKEEIFNAEQKRKLPEVLQAKKYMIKLWEMAERSEDESEMFETLKPLLKWAKEFQERKAKEEARLAEEQQFEKEAA